MKLSFFAILSNTFPSSAISRYARQLLIVFLLASYNLTIAAPNTICPQRMTLDIDSYQLQMAYCGNVNVDTSSSQIDRILVIIHGSQRNANDYYNYTVNAGILAEDSDQTTAIVAPYFLTEEDVDDFNLTDDMLFWSSSGWKKGNTSNQSTAHPRTGSISSFAVVDELIDRLIANNPNVNQVVIAGHSAGGQFVNRYAAGGLAQTWNQEISFRYLAANPSSWLYFSPERVSANDTNQFEVPEPGNCPDYNDYKYGLLNLNNYMSAVGSFKLMQNYQDRNVIYLLGEEDNDPNSSSLATSCSAMLQGDHRLQRGEIYFNYVNGFFGAASLASHHKEMVAGVGHSASNMFQSDCGLYFLYDYPTGCNPLISDQPPLAPKSLIGAVVTHGKGKNKQKTVILNWFDQSKNETEFVIERCLRIKGKNAYCKYAELVNLNQDITEYIDQPGSLRYKYRIKSRNEFGDSAYSNEVSF